MNVILRHVTRSFIAGVVALLPVGGLVLAVLWMETTIAASWLATQPFYFPGLGLLAAVVGIYVIGLLITTFIGRWLFSLLDAVLDELPVLGTLYRTLKQVLGYGEGEDALFERVVLVPSRESDAMELGLVTNRVRDEQGEKLVVFVPSSPTPTTGRLLLLDPSVVHEVDLAVSEALTALVALGKTDAVGSIGGHKA